MTADPSSSSHSHSGHSNSHSHHDQNSSNSSFNSSVGGKGTFGKRRFRDSGGSNGSKHTSNPTSSSPHHPAPLHSSTGGAIPNGSSSPVPNSSSSDKQSSPHQHSKTAPSALGGGTATPHTNNSYNNNSNNSNNNNKNNNNNNGKSTSNITNVKAKKHLHLSAVQSALEENEDGVENMRREVTTFQEGELSAAQRELVVLRKQHDKLYQDADAADVLHKSVNEELSHLERLAGVGIGSRTIGGRGRVDPLEKKNDLLSKIAETEERVRDANEQKQVFGHMIERLKGILLELSKVDNSARAKDALLSSERASWNLQHQQAKVDLKDEEDKMEDLLKRLTTKRLQHQSRILGIRKIIEERSVLLERQEERSKKKDEMLSKADMGVDEEQKLKRMNVIRQMYTTILEKKMTDDEEHLNQLEDTFHRLKNVTGLSNVEEVVDKFLSRNEKNKQLQAVADDLRKRIEMLKEENIQSTVTLGELIEKTEANTGNREIYQEVDLIDVAVGSSTKQCEDSKNREARLSVTIGELRETTSRFMSKIANELKPIPTIKDLPEKIHSLDLDLAEMMKAVAANLSKGKDDSNEDSPDREKKGGSSDGSGSPTFSSKVAGANLGKIMFHKMMNTEPDQTNRNVRVSTIQRSSELERHTQRLLLDPHYENTHPPTSSKQQPHHEIRIPFVEDENEFNGKVVDRETMKKLAKLAQKDELNKKKKKKAEESAYQD